MAGHSLRIPAASGTRCKYGIKGIPSLVVIDDQGNLITKDGRAEMNWSDSNARKALREWRRAAGKDNGSNHD